MGRLFCHFLVAFASLWTVAAGAESVILMKDPTYLGGKALYTDLLKDRDAAYRPDKGNFLELPLDYGDVTKGSFDLYYRLSKNFDPKKPTILFFAGGPGQAVQGFKLERRLKQFNVVYFNQRGVTFSRPRKYSQLLNPQFFSTELIVRDAEALRRHLGLQKVSVYGVSYGSVTATVFAHQYPEVTSAVILEGVIFDGQEELWRAPYRTKMLQKFFDTLPAELQAKILDLSKDRLVPAFWFTRLARVKMMRRNFEENLRGDLDALFELPQTQAVQDLRDQFSPVEEYSEGINEGILMYFHIGCQEMSFSKTKNNRQVEFNRGRLNDVSLGFDEICKQIPGMDLSGKKMYRAQNYPLKMPVTYFQGTQDGATAAPYAMKHFKQVAQDAAQLIYVVGGGHSPMMECLTVDCSVRDVQKAVDLFERAAAGQNISVESLRALNTQYAWKKASRLRSIIPQN